MTVRKHLSVRLNCVQINMKKGFVAISSVLIILAITLVVGVTVALTSITEVQRAFSARRGEQVLDRVEACIEDALYQINTRNDVPTTITLPEGTCSVTIDSHSGANWTFTVSGTASGYTKSIQVMTTRSNTITPVSWKDT